jgi:hypothetical protein
MERSTRREVAFSCLAAEDEYENPANATGRLIMAYFEPELIQTMRAALEEVMTRVPVGHATQSVKAKLAAFILGAAAHGQTTFDGLVSSASDRIQQFSRY